MHLNTYVFRHAWVAALLALSMATLAAEDLPATPNFVIIMADDLGYGDIKAGPFEGWIDTPHLDRMAQAGLSLTDFHSNGSVCSPTRAALLTGRYQQRAGIDGVVNADPKVPSHKLGLDPEYEVTFARSLKSRGYATAIFGKWHLGYDSKYNPVHHGFDHFRGFVSGNVDYFSHVDRAGTFDWWIDDRTQQEEGYSTHLIIQHTLEFIRKNKDKPFCVYVPHEAPHYPYQGPNDQAIRSVGDGNPRVAPGVNARDAYCEMVQAVDHGVGQIVDLIDELDLSRRTMIVFCSDNGAVRPGSNGDLRGQKGQVWEGGHRVPAIVVWPGVIRENTVSDATALTMDLMPTMLDAAGANLPDGHKVDGVSLMPLLRGGTLSPRQLFWGQGASAAMREGSWKLVLGKPDARKPALFDLSNDLGEKNDLAKNHPERASQMLDAIKQWQQDVKATRKSRS